MSAKRGYVDLAAMRERIRQTVHDELGAGVRVSIEITDSPRRYVRVEVERIDMTIAEVAFHRGTPWGDN
jgi:hypothetical protein